MCVPWQPAGADRTHDHGQVDSYPGADFEGLNNFGVQRSWKVEILTLACPLIRSAHSLWQGISAESRRMAASVERTRPMGQREAAFDRVLDRALVREQGPP